MESKIDTKLNIPWSRQKTPLEAYLGQILGPCWTKLGSKLVQVGAKLGQVGTKLGQVGAKLGHAGAKMGQVGAKLGQVGQDGQEGQVGPSLAKLEPKKQKVGPGVPRPGGLVVLEFDNIGNI